MNNQGRRAWKYFLVVRNHSIGGTGTEDSIDGDDTTGGEGEETVDDEDDPM